MNARKRVLESPPAILLIIGIGGIVLALAAIVASGTQPALARPNEQICGDLKCENLVEDCNSCPQDCGPCNPPPPQCGDLSCDPGEDCQSCEQDCGACNNPPPGGQCGNEIIEPGEACDGVGQDACGENEVCQGCQCGPGYCGDGVWQAGLGEQCEGGFGCPQGVACTANCTCETAPVAPSGAVVTCGDGVINQAWEQCDGAALGTCTACTTDCTCAGGPVGFCGDGVINQASEFCDGAALGTCTACTTDCTCAGGPVGFCGNGLVEPGEECDQGADPFCADGTTCVDCRCGLRQRVIACGDGVLQEDLGERCDPPGGDTCVEGEGCNLETCQCVPFPENCLTVDPDRIERGTYTEEDVTLTSEEASALGVECCTDGVCDLTFSVEYFMNADGEPVLCGAGVVGACRVIHLAPENCFTVDPASLEEDVLVAEDISEEMGLALGLECCADGTCDLIETRTYFVDGLGHVNICSYEAAGVCEPVLLPPIGPGGPDGPGSGHHGAGTYCIDVFDADAFEASHLIDGPVTDYDSLVLWDCQLPDPSETDITVRNGTFPPVITVPIFTEITWTNADPGMHTVTSDDNSFSSGMLAQGQAFSHTFNLFGEFPYHSEGEASMTGVIRVVPECEQRRLESRYGGLKYCATCLGDWCEFGPGRPACTLVAYDDMPDLWRARYDRVEVPPAQSARDISDGVWSLVCPQPPTGHVCIPIDEQMGAVYENPNEAVGLTDCFSGEADDDTLCPVLGQTFTLETDQSGQDYLCFDAGEETGFQPSCGPHPDMPINGCAFSAQGAGQNILMVGVPDMSGPAGMPAWLADTPAGRLLGTSPAWMGYAIIGLLLVLVIAVLALLSRLARGQRQRRT